MSRTQKQEFGAWGEQQAAEYLVKRGYNIIDRNYKVKKGEIDIIAWHTKYHHGRTLCFIEVKTRGEDDGEAERATQGKKLPRFFQAARSYCLDKLIPMDRTPMQFEQVSVYAEDMSQKPEFRQYVIPVE
ncbi:MAG: YraN family protein [Patescibacteria group bacterium]